MLEAYRPLIESQVPMVLLIGSSASGVPLASRGAGALLEDEHIVRVSLSAPWVPSLRAQLEENPRVSLSFVDVETYEALQAKGTFVELVVPDDEDRAQADLYFARFSDSVRSWMPHVECMVSGSDAVLRVRVEQLFSQTPGPGAGALLASS